MMVTYAPKSSDSIKRRTRRPVVPLFSLSVRVKTRPQKYWISRFSLKFLWTKLQERRTKNKE